MSKKSAGLLLYRKTAENLEVLLVHPGGPLWAKKDDGAWSIPKGEFAPEEDPLAAAKREFEEETGIQPDGEFIALTPLKQPGGKLVFAWALRDKFTWFIPADRSGQRRMTGPGRYLRVSLRRRRTRWLQTHP